MTRTCLVEFVKEGRKQTLDLNFCIQNVLSGCVGGSSQTVSSHFLSPGEYTLHGLHVMKMDLPAPTSYLQTMQLVSDMTTDDTLINALAIEILIQLAENTHTIEVRYE